MPPSCSCQYLQASRAIPKFSLTSSVGPRPVMPPIIGEQKEKLHPLGAAVRSFGFIAEGAATTMGVARRSGFHEPASKRICAFELSDALGDFRRTIPLFRNTDSPHARR